MSAIFLRPPSANPLTHWGRDKMDAISQTTFSNGLSWMKMYEYKLAFHWSLFLRVQLTIVQHWFRYWLGAGQVTSHYLNQWWLVYWCIYASLSLNELTNSSSPSATYMCQWIQSALVQIMACSLFATKPLYKPMFVINWTLKNKFQWNSNQSTKHFVHLNIAENNICEMVAILSRGRWVND